MTVPLTSSVAVLGAGNWGTTLANVVASNGRTALLWTRSAEQRDEINSRHTSARAVPGLSLSPGVRAVTELAEAVREAPLVLMAIPSQAFREVSRALGELLAPEQMVIHGTKGLEGKTHRRMTQILVEETCAKQVGVLAGPNIAAEVAAGKPAGTVVASHFQRVVDAGRSVLTSPRLVVFAGDDVVGIELASAFKNIVAIAAGIAAEMDVGENAKAFLVSRGLAEISRLGLAMGSSPLTLTGLAGIGDLMVTCASPQSRNHRVGRALARGEKLPAILERLGMVAEGVYAAVSAHELSATYRVEAPLLERVYRVLYEGLSPEEGVGELMRLPAGHDVGRRLRAAL
jgi:glycerol-3-phosphate dehydrogenase (NAD(P)+)